MLDINADTNVPSIFCAPGYEVGERSSPRKRGERCQWQMKRPERSAAVGINLRPLRWVEILPGTANRDKPPITLNPPGQANNTCLRNQIE